MLIYVTLNTSETSEVGPTSILQEQNEKETITVAETTK